jgi:menaquinone reductase, iron-sulfur cluster-binding subunit
MPMMEKIKMPRYGMVIDLAKCAGCGACVAACRQENNVPYVGQKLASNGRGIFWMDIIPYIEGEFPNIQARLLPRPCMQCEHPPCVRVCPVGATYKSKKTGIVGQIYERCIGCRYCVNNCPYSAKYFNWFEPKNDELLNTTSNPDVSHRGNGVVEKCTFCHHRLQKAREKARYENKGLEEGDYIPACVESCPSNAMYFGDLEDPNSQIVKLTRSGRAFSLLEDLGTEPNVIYLSEGDTYGS